MSKSYKPDEFHPEHNGRINAQRRRAERRIVKNVLNNLDEDEDVQDAIDGRLIGRYKKDKDE